MRLDRMLGAMGYGTRSEIRKACRSGWITVNGVPAKSPSISVDPDTDAVEVNGEAVQYTEFVYYMLNKPQGVISAARDDRETVVDLIDSRMKGLFPVGRLDKDTEGLLLITNDGKLGHELLSPRHHVEKEYEVTLRDAVKDSDVRRMQEGIVLSKEEKCLPAEMIITSEKTCRVILQEGKYHQIKRMFEVLGNEVTALKRIRMKNLLLDDTLAPGEYRELSEEELADLKGLPCPGE